MARKVSAGLSGGAAVAGLQAFTTTLTSASNLDITVEPAGTGRFLINGNAQLLAQGDLRFADADSSNWVAFQAPATVAANYTLTLPSTDGSNNQVLTTNGSGTLTWSSKEINVTDNTTDSNTNFVVFSSTSSGTMAARVASSRLTFQPSTGTLFSTIFSGALATNVKQQIDGLGVGTAASATTGEIRATNNITSFFSSDIKFKENIINIPNALDTVLAIGGKLFDWTDEYIATHGGEDGYFVQKQDFGVVAQDVQQVFPRAVRTKEDGTLAVDYEKLSALAFAAIVELKYEIEVLKGVK